MPPTQTAHRPHEEAPQIPTDRLQAFIETRLARREAPTQIANAARIYFDIEIDPEHVIPYWKGEITLPTQTGRRQDKESVQLPADEVNESLFTRMPNGETPEAIAGASVQATPATLTGPLQSQKSPTTPADTTKAFDAKGLANLDAPSREAEAVKAKCEIDRTPAGAIDGQATPPTLTGPLQNQKSTTALTDEIKVFIVKSLACFDTPTYVADAVRARFGIEVTRQLVHTYDPAGAHPPALRWRELHAATRQAFLQEISAISVTHKAVRLRMLDRLAHRCERNSVALALICLREAAKECGGFYERRKGLATPQDVSPSAATP